MSQEGEWYHGVSARGNDFSDETGKGKKEGICT